MTDSLRLFEVSERSERCELRNAPMLRAAQVARSAAEGRRDRGRLLFGYFLLATTRESDCAAGRISRPREEEKALNFLAHAMSARRFGAGCSPPHGDSLFLSRQAKEAKEGDPGARVPCRLAASGAACGARGLGTLHNSHHSLRSFSSNRCNESVNEARDARAPPMPLRCSARAQGWEWEPLVPSLRSARGWLVFMVSPPA